jgi:hypothetical protein
MRCDLSQSSFDTKVAVVGNFPRKCVVRYARFKQSFSNLVVDNKFQSPSCSDIGIQQRFCSKQIGLSTHLAP